MKFLSLIVTILFSISGYAGYVPDNLKNGEIVLFPFYGKYKTASVVGPDRDSGGFEINIVELTPVWYLEKGYVQLRPGAARTISESLLLRRKFEEAVTLGDGSIAKVGDSISRRFKDGQIFPAKISAISNGMVSTFDLGTFEDVSTYSKSKVENQP